MKTHVQKFIFFIFLLVFFTPIFLLSQTDTLFWFAAPEVSIHNQNYDRPILLRITTYNQPATVTVSQPAGGGMPTQIVNIPANSTQTMDLTTWIDFIETKPFNAILNYGLRIHSTSFITVYYEVLSSQCLCNPEIFALKGQNALGTDFWIPSQTYLNNNSAYNPAAYNSFDIVATEDNTTVTITPSKNIFGHAAGVPFNITLNRGQVYSATATSQTAANHLAGSRVTSNKPIAITMKDDLMHLPTCSDLGGDQLVPTDKIGTDYIVMKGFLNIPDRVFILATQNGTSIDIDGNFVTTINAGQTYTHVLSNPSAYIQASQPVYVLHLSGYGCEVGLSLIPSIVCTGSSSVSIVRSTSEALFINVMVQNGGQGNFLVNGNPGVITAASFSLVPGTSGQWLSAQVSLPVGSFPQNQPISITNSTNLFHLGMIHGGAGSGTRFGYFSNFATIEAIPTANSSNVCDGDSIQLFCNFFPGATYSWFGPNNFTSTTQNPAIPNANATMTGWYVVSVNFPGGICGDTDSIFVTVNSPVAPPTVNDTTICNGQNTTLNATAPTGATFLWYDAPNAGNLLFTGNPFITSNLTDTTTYYVEAVVNNCTSARSAVTVHVNSIPNAPTVNDTTICVGQNASLNATAPVGAAFLWYDAPNAGNLLFTGNPFNTPNLTDTTTYYVEAVVNNCTSARSAVKVNVNPIPNAPSVNDTTLCAGQNVSLNATAPAGATFLWYDAPNAGNLLFTGNPFNTPNLNDTTTYYVEAFVNNCTSARSAVKVNVNPIPNAPTVNDTTICTGQNAFLNATAPAGATFLWYNAPNAGNLLFTGNTFSTPNLTDTTTYYVEAVVNNCTSARSAVKVNVNPIPNAPTVNDTTICTGQNVSLNATAPAGATFLWYDAPTAGNLLFTGNPFSTPNLNDTTTYYVEAVVNNCTSARSALKVNVNPTPSAPAVQDTTICSVESVVLNATDPQGATFLWYDAPSAGNLLFSGNTFTTPALNDTTTYYVEAVANNCTSARSAATVNVVLLQTTDLLDSLCANQSHVLTVTPPANVNVLWYDNAGNFLSNQPNLNIQLGTNDTLFAYEFTAANCTSNRSTFTIQALPAPKALFTVRPDKDTILSPQEAVYDFTNLTQDAVRYVWYFGDGDSLVTTDLSNVTHQYTKEGQYDVTLCATNNYGCTDCYTYGKLIVANQIAIFIPNVFTPNGDGINDFFKFEMSGIQSAEIQIFDRWGVLIFETGNGLNTFWNGTKNGSPCPEGVYTYVMKLVRFDGKKITRFGSLILIR